MKLNQKGFTLAEIVVAAGLLGIVSLGVMRLVDNMNKSQKTFETKSEIVLVTNSIAQSLTNEEACKNTFSGINLVTDSSVASIQNSTGASIFDVGSVYGNRSVRLTSLDIDNVSLANDGSSKSGTFELLIGLEKLNSQNQGGLAITKRVTISVITDLSDDFVGCFNSAAGATKNSCENIGGTFDSASQNCDLVPYPGIASIPTDPSAQREAISQKYIDDLINDLDARYIFKGNDDLSLSLPINTTTIGNNATADTVTLNSRVTIQGATTVNGTVQFNEHVTVANGKYIAMESDKRLKKNIKPIKNVLSSISAIRGVHFDWRNSGNADIGVIAQEIRKVYPDLVVRDKESGVFLVKYPQLSAIAIEAVKALKKENTKLKSDIAELKSVVCEIERTASICQKEAK
jgi:prepilin-type N-terminal cleavage/methylation domain-containing protein